MIKAKGKVNAFEKSVCRIGLKVRSNVRRLYLYYLFLKPYRGKPDVRNFREGAGNVDKKLYISLQGLLWH